MAKRRLIDANALLKAYWEEQKKPGIYSIEKMILDAPIVDAVEVKSGKPVPHYQTWCNSDGEPVTTLQLGYECPFCGDPDIKYFCPNCGAKMEGVRIVCD